MSRLAYAQVERPQVFRQLETSVKLPTLVVEEAFLKANPALDRDMQPLKLSKKEIAQLVAFLKALSRTADKKSVLRREAPALDSAGQQDSVVEALLLKHFRLWDAMATPANDAVESCGRADYL